MKRKSLWLILIALLIAGVLSHFASSHPDGLEQVAEKLGFQEKAAAKPLLAVLAPNYLMPGVKNQTLAASLAGISGVLLVLALGWGLGKLLLKRG